MSFFEDKQPFRRRARAQGRKRPVCPSSQHRVAARRTPSASSSKAHRACTEAVGTVAHTIPLTVSSATVDRFVRYVRHHSAVMCTVGRLPGDPACQRNRLRDMGGTRTQHRRSTGSVATSMGREQIPRGRQHRADAVAHCRGVLSSAGVAGSALLILITCRHLTWSAVRSVRRISAMAGRVANGDLSVRLAETGSGVVGDLERSFNRMADSLEISRDGMRRSAAEQAALLRIATLVAHGISPAALFGAVAAESGNVLGVATTALVRFERDRSVTVAGTWEKPGTNGIALPLRSRWPAEEGSVAERIQRTGAPTRVANDENEVGANRDWARAHGIVSSVGSPIFVDGQLWGALIAFSALSAADMDSTEDYMLALTDLVALAIANADSRAQLAASRARIVAATDEARRGIERDLHIRTQQRLISLALDLRAAEATAPAELRSQVQQWSRTAQGLTDAAEELRQISGSLYPAILDKSGLVPAVRSVARGIGIPVKLRMRVPGRLPLQVEVAAYYAVSEALANAAKHARATVIEVDADVVADELRLQVRDDGAGGADVAHSPALTGLSDRVEAADGRIEIARPAGGGTTVLVTIPLTSS